MYCFEDQIKRNLVQAIIHRYHKTRLADESIVDFVLRGPQVQEELKNLISLYMTG